MRARGRTIAGEDSPSREVTGELIEIDVPDLGYVNVVIDGHPVEPESVVILGE